MPRESQRRFKLDAVDVINKSLKVRFTKIIRVPRSVRETAEVSKDFHEI